MGKRLTNANTPSGVFQCFTPDLYDGRAPVPLRVSATTGPLTVKLSGGVYLPTDSLPSDWKAAKVRIRVWPVFRRARPRVSKPAASPVLRLAPGKWAGEIWQDLDNDSKVGVGDLQRSRNSEPWCILRPFEIDKGDSSRLSPDCRIRLPKPVTDTTLPKRANP